jgi:hypothetical protein
MPSKPRTYPIRRRKNLVGIRDFAKLSGRSPRLPAGFWDAVPDVLAGRGFRELVSAMIAARKKKRPVVLALGGHVVKCGLSPIIIDLMRRGMVTCVAMNGATAIHDYEISLIGGTSEDVGTAILDGSFGMARETPEFFSRACDESRRSGCGLGSAAGRLIIREKNPHAEVSILAASSRLKAPCTVHVAFGTDTIHMHDCVDPGALGEATMSDFRILCGVVQGLEGGVWLNIGSAVILPEVFLKAVALARNLGRRLDRFTTANLDMIQHYRPVANVVKRPGARGINLTGHHELMLPLLWAALVGGMGGR